LNINEGIIISVVNMMTNTRIASESRGQSTSSVALVLLTVFMLAGCSDAGQPTQSAAAPKTSAAVEPAKAIPAEEVPAVVEVTADEPELVHGFELSDMDGHQRHSDEWGGKPLLINFWATWCIPCRKEMPALMELHEKYADQGFVVIGIAADEQEKIAAFLEETHVSYPILFGEMSSVFDISEQYGNVIGVLPHTAFVDRDGVIRHIKVGEISHEEAEEMVLDIL
jgi:thiol-disulfide isomerase/thioredoxin